MEKKVKINGLEVSVSEEGIVEIKSEKSKIVCIEIAHLNLKDDTALPGSLYRVSLYKENGGQEKISPLTYQSAVITADGRIVKEDEQYRSSKNKRFF